MDPLEDVLALVGAAGYVSAGMIAGGRWAVRFEPPAGVKFDSVRRGNCLVRVDGTAEPSTAAAPRAVAECRARRHATAVG